MSDTKNKQDLRKTSIVVAEQGATRESAGVYTSVNEDANESCNAELPKKTKFCVSPDKVEVFTDGSCQGNPGPGGWAALLRYQTTEKTLAGAELATTNNRMELLAAINALKHLKRRCDVVLTTDSDYLRSGITKWISKWKKNGWKTSDRKPVKNSDLWTDLDELVQQHHVEWRWVKAHSGHRENEIVDSLAKQAITELLQKSRNT